MTYSSLLRQTQMAVDSGHDWKCTRSRLNYVLFLMLCCAVALNCSDSSNPTGVNSFVGVVPLAVGNTWNYHDLLHDTGGAVYAQFNTTEFIAGDTVIGTQKWYYQDNHGLYFGLATDGFRTYDMYEADTSRIALVYKYPCTVGDTYSHWEVMRSDTTITVPAGTFTCILYSYRQRTLYSFKYSDVFIKPGIGKIKVIDYGFVDTNPIFVWSVSELIDFDLKRTAWPK